MAKLMWSKTLGTVLGLGIILILLAGGYYVLILPLTASPPRPEFENEFPITGPIPKPKPTPVASPASPQPSPSPTATPEDVTGIVIEPIGLSVRRGPSRQEETLGGVALNETVTILAPSSDGQFYQVRTQSGLEGWVIAAGIQANSPIPSPVSPKPEVSPNSQ